MVASKGPRWSSVSVPCILVWLLLLLHAGDARLLRIASETSVEVAEVVHRWLQTAAPYCIATSGANETQLLNALNWACGSGTGQGNVDCSAIQQGGSCYSPDSLTSHASYAFDLYYVSQQGSTGSCDFGGVATTSSTNPSSGTCSYPSLGSGTPSGTPSSSNSTLTAPPPPASNSIISISPTSTSSSSSSGSNDPVVRLHWITTSSCALLVMAFLSTRL